MCFIKLMITQQIIVYGMFFGCNLNFIIGYVKIAHTILNHYFFSLPLNRI